MKDGSIQKGELYEAMKTQGDHYHTGEASTSTFTWEDIERIFTEYDADGNHAIDFDEFTELFRSMYEDEEDAKM